MDMYNLISSLLRYIFITIIYLFIYAIIKLIYSDIQSMNSVTRPLLSSKCPYLRETKKNSVYPLNKKDMVAGRGNKCDIKLYGYDVAESHFHLWYENEEWHIEDLGSRSGTTLNGERMEEVYFLDDGDCIEIGDTKLEFCMNK